MESADQSDVFTRLGKSKTPFLNETDKEMPLPEDHWGETPLFLHQSVKERKE